MTDEKLTLNQRISKFVEILSQEDWAPDGHNDKQGYWFISHKKIKRNVSKASLDAGLVWKIDYDSLTPCEAVGMMKQHYIIRAVGRLSDVNDANSCETYIAYGEAADSGDKAISKAQTSAFKAIINNNFFIADVDADAEEIISNNDSIKADARTGYEARQEIFKDKVIREASLFSPDPVDSAGGTAPSGSAEGAVSSTQRTVMDKIMNKAKTLPETELLPFGNIIQIESDFLSVKTADDAQKFISAYTGVLRCQ